VAVAALWCKGWGGRRPGGHSACLPSFAAAWVRGPLPGAPASAVTLPPHAALTPAPTCAILSERAHCVMETMALYRLYTSSSRKQASAGTSSAPPCARSATLGPPALLLAFSRFRAQCARSHTLHSHPSPPAGPWPFRSTLHSPRPSPCSCPVLRLFRAPDSALPAPLSPRRATTPRISCCIRWNRWGPPPPPVGRTSVRPLTLLSSPCSTAVHAPPAHCLRIAPSSGDSAPLWLCCCDSRALGITMRSLRNRCRGGAPVYVCLQCDGLLMELWGGLKSPLRFA
jgi:hypothetical protein